MFQLVFVVVFHVPNACIRLTRSILLPSSATCTQTSEHTLQNAEYGHLLGKSFSKVIPACISLMESLSLQVVLSLSCPSKFPCNEVFYTRYSEYTLVIGLRVTRVGIVDGVESFSQNENRQNTAKTQIAARRTTTDETYRQG